MPTGKVNANPPPPGGHRAAGDGGAGDKRDIRPHAAPPESSRHSARAVTRARIRAKALSVHLPREFIDRLGHLGIDAGCLLDSHQVRAG